MFLVELSADAIETVVRLAVLQGAEGGFDKSHSVCVDCIKGIVSV